MLTLAFVQRQAIRKKIESELARKRTISTTASNNLRNKRLSKTTGAKGTVAALKPSSALTVPESMTVADASQLCAAKRTDCVLVVDDEEGLSGIFTAKDLAFRVSDLIAWFFKHRLKGELVLRSLPRAWILVRHLLVLL
jgi:signal-transduction protein with cAMP-binding, CBS, and nucleotidyltransferase domain